MRLNRRQLRRLIQESLFSGGLRFLYYEKIGAVSDEAKDAVTKLLELQRHPNHTLELKNVHLVEDIRIVDRDDPSGGREVLDGVYLGLTREYRESLDSDTKRNAKIALESIFAASAGNDKKAYDILKPFIQDNKGFKKASNRLGDIGFGRY